MSIVFSKKEVQNLINNGLTVFVYIKVISPITERDYFLLMEPHTRRGAKGSEDGSRHGGDDLHDPLDGFLFRHTLSDFNGLIHVFIVSVVAT